MGGKDNLDAETLKRLRELGSQTSADESWQAPLDELDEIRDCIAKAKEAEKLGLDEHRDGYLKAAADAEQRLKARLGDLLRRFGLSP